MQQYITVEYLQYPGRNLYVHDAVAYNILF